MVADLGALGDGGLPAVAVLGLGRMGSALTAALVRQGFDVTVWDRDPGRTAAVAAATRCAGESTPGRAGRHADAVLTVLRDADAARRLLLVADPDSPDGPDPVAAQLRPDALVVDATTSSPRAARALASGLDDLGLRMVEAPLVGGPREAARGTLTTLAGGDPAVVDLALPVLQAWSAPGRVLPTGPVGSAAAVKLTSVIATATALEGIGEALRLGQDLGLDRGLVVEALRGGPLGELVGSRERMLAGRDAARAEYPVDMFLAEMSLALYETGSALPAAEAAFLQARLAASEGQGDHDAVEVALRREAAAARESAGAPAAAAGAPAQPAG